MQQLARILLFGHVILLLKNQLDCAENERKVYTLQLVSGIHEIPEKPDDDSSNIDDSLGFLNAETVPFEQERLNMCKEAVQFINKKRLASNVEILKNFTTDILRWYKLLGVSKNQPSNVQAFECPTKPEIYLNVNRENEVLIVNVIIRRRDLTFLSKTTDVEVEDMCFALKQVKEILPSDPAMVTDLQLEERIGSFNTDRLSEPKRMKMCRRARSEIEASGVPVDIVFTPKGRTGDSRLYLLQSEEDFSYSVARAFYCPTMPAIYLEVVQIGDERDKMYYVWVITETNDLTSYFYQTKVVQEITVSPKLGRSHSEFTTEDRRLHMCREAFEKLLQVEGRFVEFLDDMRPERSRYYRVQFKSGRQQDILAFQCPTRPPMYLSLDDQGALGVVLVLIEETEPIFPRLNIIAFRTKFFEDITEVSSEHQISPASMRHSAVNFTELTETEFEELCRLAVKMIPKMNVTFVTESGREPSKNYVLVTNVENQINGSEYVMVHALKCRTDPEIYLHVESKIEGEGNIAWICVTETGKSRGVKIAGFLTKTVSEILEVPQVEVRQQPSSLVAKSAINTDKLDEDQRRTWCRSATIQALSRSVIRFLEDINTGTMKYYALKTESDNNTFVSAYVEAFECPTEPVIYLHIEDEIEGDLVWIIIEEHKELFPHVEFNSYELKLVQNITEASKNEVRNLASSSRKESWALDTDMFTEKYRRQLCENSVLMALTVGNVRIIEDRPTGMNFHYSVKEENQRPIKIVAGFRCPTSPPLFLEVRNTDYQTYAVRIYINKPDLVNGYNEVYYVIRFVDEITEVQSSEFVELGSFEFDLADIDKLTEPERFQMCVNALTQYRLVDRDIELFEDKSTRPKKLYLLKQQSEEQNGPPRIVQAFECPTQPCVYLQVHKWESEVYIAWVILEKDEPRLSDEETISEESKESLLSSEVVGTNFKIKYVQTIDEAFVNEVNLLPSGLREETMINTDKRYRERERFQMCARAVSMMSEENILKEEATGRSKFFVVQEGFTDDKFSEFMLVRAFECPTERPLYLQVRYREGRGNCVTVLIKDDKQCTMNFKFKFVDSVAPAETTTQEEPVLSYSDEFTAAKRLQICKRATQVIPDLSIALLSSGLAETNENYVVKYFSEQLENVRAFKCPTERIIYLEIVPDSPGAYTVWVIVPWASSSSSYSSPTAFYDRNNVTFQYKVKYVRSIRRASSLQVHELYARDPDFITPDSSFTEEERIRLCEEATKLFPAGSFELPEQRHRHISRVYILNAGSKNRELVRAFRCLRIPDMYIQVKEYEPFTGRYMLLIIIEDDQASFEEDELSLIKDNETSSDDNAELQSPAKWDESPPRNIMLEDTMSKLERIDVNDDELGFVKVETRESDFPSVRHARDVEEKEEVSPYDDLVIQELLTVDKIRPVSDEEALWYGEDVLLPHEHVDFALKEREKLALCINGLLLIPGSETIAMWNKPEDVALYAINLKRDESKVSREEFIWAFACPTDPLTYVQIYVDEKSKKRMYRVVIEEKDLPPVIFEK